MRTVSEINGHRLEFDEEKHKYILNNIIVPGVTTILKTAYPTSPALIAWMIKEGIEEYKTGAKLKKAANIGTVVHEIIEKAEAGEKYEIPEIEEVKNCLKAYETFKKLRHPDERVIDAESIIASPKYGYAGKFDVLISLDGKTILRDYKTTSGIYSSALFQTALYQIALKSWKGIDVDYWQIVRFGKNGKFAWEKDVLTISDKKAMKDYTNQALRCVETFFFMQRYEK